MPRWGWRRSTPFSGGRWIQGFLANDFFITIYGIPVASGLESQDFGRDEYEALDDVYRLITDQTIANLCGRYPITYAVLFSDTATAYPVLERNDTYQLVELDNCG